MANQYKNEIIYNGQTLISLKDDTIDPSKVLSGETFHDRSGAPQQGSMITHSVYDSLDSTSTDDALSANMGRALKTSIDSLNSNTNIKSELTLGSNVLPNSQFFKCGKIIYLAFSLSSVNNGDVLISDLGQYAPIYTSIGTVYKSSDGTPQNGSAWAEASNRRVTYYGNAVATTCAVTLMFLCS